MYSSLNEFLAQTKPRAGRTLIVGSRVYQNKEDRRKHYPDVLGVDMQDGEGVDVIANLELWADCAPLGGFQHIECMSVLEHSKRPWLLAENLMDMLEPEGTITVTAPFVWKIHSYPSDYWRFTKEGIQILFPDIDWTIQKYAGRRLSDHVPAERVNDWPHFSCTDTCSFGVRWT